MKRSYKKLFLSMAIGMTIAICGCKKTLEEHPQTSITPGTFFSDPASYQLAIIGLYGDIPLYDGSMQEMPTDIYGAPAPSVEQGLPMYQNAPQPYYYNTQGCWRNGYRLIKDANFVLGALPTSPLDQATKNLLTAEAQFMRAYAYFYLVQLYGDIPMPTKVIVDNNPTNLQLPRTPQADIYKLILSDLTFAEQNLPDKAPTAGRVYKSVASALLAKVYLTMAGNPMKQTAAYQNAKDEALKVINSGLFTLLDDYANVFHHTSYTTESIWEQSYVVSKGGNPLQGSTGTADTYRPSLVPAPSFISSFPKGDRRRTWGILDQYPDPKVKCGVLAPFFQKYFDTTGVSKGATSSTVINPWNFVYIRYADMYLIAAEAENEINGPGNAYQYINIIRRRARVDKSDPTNVPDLAGLTQDGFRQAVLKERKWEFALEGNTWFDMKRTNTFQLIQAQRGSQLINPIGPYNQTWLIPDIEITANNIPQNPLY